MRYNKIRKMDISNGEGVRVSIFTQGCHFHCENCFNPETWDFNGGKEFSPDTLKLLLDLSSKDYIKGLSILGGEPLCDENFSTVKDIAITFKNNATTKDKDIWLWTGYELEDILHHPQKKEILNYIDYMIVGPYVHSKRDLCLKYAGSLNQRFICLKGYKDNKKIEILDNK